MQGLNDQKQIDKNKGKYMDNKGGNVDGGSDSYQKKKCDDKKNNKYRKLAKAGVIAAGVEYYWFTYTNGAWDCYFQKCGVNKLIPPV